MVAVFVGAKLHKIHNQVPIVPIVCENKMISSTP
jgi:hypothetical protein